MTILLLIIICGILAWGILVFEKAMTCILGTLMDIHRVGKDRNTLLFTLNTNLENINYSVERPRKARKVETNAD